jgi:translation initiation factor 2 beta subunit (eIF-2beta)/eIF-5
MNTTINIGDGLVELWKKSKTYQEEYGVCEKCGGETSTKTVGDESAKVCSSCGWITH